MSRSDELVIAAEKSSEYWEDTARLDFAAMLGAVMDSQKVSRKKLAEKVGVSRQYISKVLGAEAANFTIDSMAKLMFALGHRLCITSEPIEIKVTPTLDQILGELNVIQKSCPDKEISASTSTEEFSDIGEAAGAAPLHHWRTPRGVESNSTKALYSKDSETHWSSLNEKEIAA